MDLQVVERLKRLQMEDLGTARREYISTADSKRIKSISLEDVEATRLSNKAGSEAQRAAEVNRSRLSSWANVYKELGDSQDLEHLDNLLDGQTHRSQLSALIQNSGGQSYTKSVNKKDNFLKAAEMDRGHGPSRRSHHTGRGGGVIGTRGRRVTPISSSTSVRASNQGAVSKLGCHVVEATPGRTRMDPALESNDNPYKKSCEENTKLKTRSRTRNKISEQRPERTTLRTRRPIVGDYARILSPPENFLAIARGMVSTRTPDHAPVTAPQNPSINSDKPANGVRKAAKGNYFSPEKATNPIPRQSTEKTAVPLPPNESSRATSIPGSTVHRPVVPGIEVSPAPTSSAKRSAENGEDESSEQICSGFPEQELSASGAINEQAASADSHKDIITPETESEPSLLLDFSSTPPERSPLEGMSSSFEDLKGIDFRHPTDESASQGSSLKTTLNLTESGSKKLSNELKTDITPPTDLSNNDVALAKHQQDLSLVTALLESPTFTSFGNEFYQKSKQCKEELEIKVQRALQESTVASGLSTESQEQEAASQRQGNSALEELPKNKSEPTPSAEKSMATPKVPETPTESAPGEQDKKTDISPFDDSASPQWLRQAVLASPFHPRSGSFTSYRSPRNSISSDSTSPPPTPVPTRPAAIPIRKVPLPTCLDPKLSHIFGDHLLPGRHSRVASALRSVSSTSPTCTDKHNTSKVGFSIPTQCSVRSNVNNPVFESPKNTKSSTQTEATNSIPLPPKIEPISLIGSQYGTSADKEATREPSKSQSTPHVASGVKSALSSLGQSTHAAKPPTQLDVLHNAPLLQNIEPATHTSSTEQLGTNPVPPKIAPICTIPKKVKETESKLCSFGQSIHAPPRQDASKRSSTSVNPKTVQRADLNLSSSNRSVYASPPKSQQRSTSANLSGILNSRHAMPENYRPVP